MPMGIVSDAQFEDELRDSCVDFPTNSKSPSNKEQGTSETQESVRGEVIEMPGSGRTEGATEVPNSLRNIIANEVIEHGRKSGLELAAHFGVKPSSVSAYSNGSTSTTTYDKKPNRDFIAGMRNRITKRASKKLLVALDNLTDEKMSSVKATDLAVIAKSMSGIVKDMSPELESLDKPIPPQIVVFAPAIRNEQKYEMIFAKE